MIPRRLLSMFMSSWTSEGRKQLLILPDVISSCSTELTARPSRKRPKHQIHGFGPGPGPGPRQQGSRAAGRLRVGHVAAYSGLPHVAAYPHTWHAALFRLPYPAGPAYQGKSGPPLIADLNQASLGGPVGHAPSSEAAAAKGHRWQPSVPCAARRSVGRRWPLTALLDRLGPRCRPAPGAPRRGPLAAALYQQCLTICNRNESQSTAAITRPPGWAGAAGPGLTD